MDQPQYATITTYTIAQHHTKTHITIHYMVALCHASYLDRVVEETGRGAEIEESPGSGRHIEHRISTTMLRRAV